MSDLDGRTANDGDLFDGSLVRHWTLDRSVAFLNHGSFGACPRPVLERQTELRQRMESEPVRFLSREMPGLLERARADLAGFVGCAPSDLAFVPNATGGVNSVLRSLAFRPGDEIVLTDHEYNACRAAAAHAAHVSGARLRVVHLPIPLPGPEAAVEAVIGALGERSRLLLIDHVTSPTACVLPVERIVHEAEARGVMTLVDGAHAPGMVPLDLDRLGASFYTGNCHKWLCAPKGSALLHVRADRQPLIHPLAISHGYDQPLEGRTRFQTEFDWTGTCDPTPFLCLPEAIGFLGGLLSGGWPALMARNRTLATLARETLCRRLGAEPVCPAGMLGSMAAVLLPGEGTIGAHTDPLQARLMDERQIEAVVLNWPGMPRRLLRVSAQAYNSDADYERLAGALADLLAD